MSWTNDTKSGITEVSPYMTLSTADSDVLLLNTSGDKLELNPSKTLSDSGSWTNDAKS